MSQGSRDPTLLDTPAARRGGVREAADVPPNYEPVALIGRGGMGEVIAARDRHIGRDVAIKRLRDSRPDAAMLARFLREARIQARLEHPAIVPVYELGTDAAGLPYFAMKRLAGTTLHERIVAEPTRVQPLLRAFAEACRAIELAHARGVVHRDLKPENIMLGDYGEVYVIDWGLARVLADDDVPVSQGGESSDGETVAGVLLGTPGYMSPEQARDASAIDRPTDVYALGAILYEILAGQPLHPRGREPALESTLTGTEGSPAKRVPDRSIAMELDALCVAALAQDPAARPTAGDLARSIERYLDGDRDVERRRAMAIDELARARSSLAAGDRREAMRAAGRALALDPETRDAAELVTRLMLEPPANPPAELQDAIASEDGKLVRRHALTGGASYAGFVFLAPIAIAAGVQSWPALLVTAGLALVLSAFAFSLVRDPSASPRAMIAYMIGNALASMTVERLFGPFVFVPAFCCVSTMSLAAYPALATRMRGVVGCQLAAWAIPIALEATGVLAASWEMKDGALVIHSNMIELGGAASIALLVVTSALLIVVGGLLAGRVARARLAAQHDLLLRDWHMRQLLPSGS